MINANYLKLSIQSIIFHISNIFQFHISNIFQTLFKTKCLYQKILFGNKKFIEQEPEHPLGIIRKSRMQCINRLGTP